MGFENLNVSIEQLWASGFILTLMAIMYVLFLIWRIKPARFRQLKWYLVGAAALFWGVFATSLVWAYWESYYQYIYPTWVRSGGIQLFVPLFYGLLALTFYWLSLRLPGNPVLLFCLLGGIESIFEHLWGIYGVQILETPILQDTSPLSILIFAIPEYIFYWCVVLSLAALVQIIRRRFVS